MQRLVAASVMVTLSPRETSTGWTPPVGSGKGWQPRKILPGDKWPSPATPRTQPSNDIPCVLPWRAGQEEQLAGFKDAGIYIYHKYTRDPHMSPKPLPRQLTCSGGCYCTTSGQACPQETRALRCARARLPSCPKRAHGAEGQMSSSWDVRALQWSVGQQLQRKAVGKSLQWTGQDPKTGRNSAAPSCHAAVCKREFKKINFSAVFFRHSNLKGKRSEGFLFF